MKSSLPNPRRAIWTNCYVLWANKLPSYISDDDEYYLLLGSSIRMAVSIYGWYRYSHKERRTRIWGSPYSKTLQIYPSSFRQTGKERPLPQTRKMQIQKERDRIPETNYQQQCSPDGPQEAERSCRLAYTMKPYGNMPISRFHRILSVFCPKLLRHCTTSLRSHKEIDSVALGKTLPQSVWRT